MDIDKIIRQVEEELRNTPNLICPYRSNRIPFRQGIGFDCDVDSGHIDFIKGIEGARNSGTKSPIKEIYITDIDSCVARFVDGQYAPESGFGVVPLPDAPTAIVSIGGWCSDDETPQFKIGENGIVDVWQRDIDDAVNIIDIFDDYRVRPKRLLTMKDAESFASFIGQIGEKGAERLVIHCGSGISRSSAAAAAASKALWGDDLWVFARPNEWGPNIDVYTKLLYALGLLDDLNDGDCVPRARHHFAEWCFRGDGWLYESYNADIVDFNFYGKDQFDETYDIHDPSNGKYPPEHNPLIGTRDWALLQKLQNDNVPII